MPNYTPSDSARELTPLSFISPELLKHFIALTEAQTNTY